ncbi:zinc ribbon domain-containing protein [Serratia fonticola]|uniref:zinc ribbon domain-containing protein n=1 Tax=Serratia fonticola TaxID=47917 RepID=UPI002179B9D4|nr:zinc ribbon domain-containing protein [Serratia fonticola]CAI1011859.1 Predicted membrane protein [Serratia fonticola]
MYCNKCGATLEVDDRFCRACGTSTYSIKKSEEQNPWTASTSPPPEEKKASSPIIVKPQDSKFLSFIKRWAYRIIVLVVASIAMVLAKPIGKMLVDEYQESKFWDELPAELDKVKKDLGVPKRIDELTIINDMYVTGHEVHYEYILNDIELNAETKPAIAKVALDAFNKALCDNLMITKFSGTSVYTYKFPNGDVTYKFTKSDCRP